MKNLDLSDYYYDDETFDYVEDDDVFYTDPIQWDSVNVKSVFEMCIFPSVQQVSTYIFVLLASCFVCRLFWFINERFLQKGETLQHGISLVGGFIALSASIGRTVWIILLLSLFSYGVLKLVVHCESKNILQSKNTGVLVGVVTIATNVICELASNSPDEWNSLRGIQMVIAMKVISLAFDVETKEDKEKPQAKILPSVLPYLGYIFCPASCVHGPWLPYNMYVRSMQKSANGLLQSIMWTASNTILALGTLSISNCLAPLLCSERSYKWIRAYRDALIVRTSHYFISFISQATLATSGFSWDSTVSPNKILGNVVTKPWAIELPRSLSSLVRNWNIPMHAWLKTYVFRKAQVQTNNYLVAVLVTYLTSSLLHGLYYQIHAVLLSIGCFAYIEYLLRKKLADVFDACIAAASCRKSCAYSYCNKRVGWWAKSSLWEVLLINIFFGFLAVVYLAYLGVMLSSDEDGKSSLKDSIARWHQLDYLGHCVVLAMFAFNCCI